MKRGDRVGVYLNRSLETAIAIYGIMDAGAAYVPLDPGAPPQRTRYLIGRCGIKVVVTNAYQRRGWLKILQKETGLQQIIGVKEEWPVPTVSWEEVYQMPTHNPSVKNLEQDLAYIMFTSGSTGLPKGIMHTHYSGLAYAKLSAGLYNLTPDDRIGNHAPLHFDISTLGYFSSPLAGATTIIVSDAHTKMPASLSQLMEKEQLTVWYSVPLALVQLLQKGILEKRDLTSLRWVLYGGEPFPVKHLRALMEQWPHTRFSNVYGPAEVNQCTYCHFTQPPKEDGATPLGQVWDNTEMLVVNEKGQEAQTGETGELLIRTATMMQGYWHDPALTERAFFKRESESGIEEVFYKTGDLVKMESDGLLYFIGRKDRQIKTRGYRVELDEVTTILLLHEAVEEAAAFPIYDDDGNLAIGAAVISKKDVVLESGLLLKHAAEHLPSYALPQKVILVEDFPRTSTGKVNYSALRRWVMNNGQSSEEPSLQ